MVSPDFLSYLSDVLAPLGSVRSKRMFGGVGIYIDGLFCAIILDDCLYFKADDDNEAQFRAAHCVQFTYQKLGETCALRYYRVPDEAMDDASDMLRWARLGMAAALRKQAQPQTKKKKSSSVGGKRRAARVDDPSR
ncbi:TfoX/Sxy family protein [Rugamonas apoptosis]|uniref:TfoX/Sxy family protein n=1 Tax=Rugamonas apoptosis TaxID=2758570 RepID=A0A7W2IIV9_9BURK|nr:TfoX/Sxy family protein [Rugamonas apoptosis]MBA5685849.1 TfoX/Sxy family protein [Rugamonas apoptosis]